MAGMEAALLDGGLGAPVLTTQSAGMGRGIGGSGVQPHHGVIGLVLVAVLILWALDKFGFRFAVTAGRR